MNVCFGVDIFSCFLLTTLFTFGEASSQKRKLLRCNCTGGSAIKPEGPDGGNKQWGACLFDESAGKYFCETFGGCMKSVYVDKYGDYSVKVAYSCVTEDNWKPAERPLVCEMPKPLMWEHRKACCNNASFCNALLNVALPPQPHNPVVWSNWQVVVLCVLCFLVFLSLIAVAQMWRKRGSFIPYPFSACCGGKSSKPSESELLVPVSSEHVKNIDDILEALGGDPSWTGSGSGLPLLAQRRVARQIQVLEQIGAGRFGEVRRGIFRGEEVAVKVFHARDYCSWEREVEMYITTMLRHDCLLGFIAADINDTGISTQCWLVTQYHANGSLYDYLNRHLISIEDLCRMAKSIANGLNHLHVEITGAPYSKPAIAHRDLKSKNILVRLDHSCCIGDMGLAVRFDSSTGTIDVPKNSNKVGTRRYLAPEVLSNEINPHQFDSYKRADIYSLGLVFWEMTRRTNIGELPDSYEPPYFDQVSTDASFEELRKVVCEDTKRPTISNRWLTHPVLGEFCSIMKECWAINPAARLTALRVRKSVEKLSAVSLDMSAPV